MFDAKTTTATATYVDRQETHATLRIHPPRVSTRDTISFFSTIFLASRLAFLKSPTLQTMFMHSDAVRDSGETLVNKFVPILTRSLHQTCERATPRSRTSSASVAFELL